MKATVERELAKEPPAGWFIHYNHGSEYVMWGDDERPIIDLSNLSKLSGMRVYCMNCSSGKGLGFHAVSEGITEYWGYMDLVSFTTDAEEEFGRAFNYGLIKAVNEGKQLREVLEATRQNGYDIAGELSSQGKILAASALVRDMNALHCYYEGGPDPPAPTCPISRGLMRIFGVKGLRKLRSLRQKLFPGRHPGRK